MTAEGILTVLVCILSCIILILLYRNRIFRKKLTAPNTQLLESIAKLESILASMGDGVVVTNSQGVVTLMNVAAEDMLRVPRSSFIGKKWPNNEIHQVVDEQGNTIPTGEIPISKVLKEHRTVVNQSVYYTRNTNDRFPVAVSAAPIRYENSIIGAVVVFRDISKSIAVDKAKSEFVSLASHQLRTPLSAINWHSEMLLSSIGERFTQEELQYVHTIRRSNKRMIDLVNALLNVSRLDLGRFAVNPEIINIQAMVEDILEDQQEEIQTKSISVDVDIADSLQNIEADPQIIQMILQNLISNAVKYSYEHTPVHITIADSYHGLKQLYMSVSDQGCGIPEKNQREIFTKLFRADNAKQLVTEGNGLGLYLIRSVVEALGGHIWFDSKENTGTTFFVTIPFSTLQQKQAGVSFVMS